MRHLHFAGCFCNFKIMKKLLPVAAVFLFFYNAGAQTAKTELYDLVKKFIPDSTGYENVGDWAVGNTKKFPVKWKEDRIIMSEDTSINFYRLGAAEIMVKGKTFTQNAQPVKWNVMLKGPRMGYTSFSIISSPGADMSPVFNIDSVFGKKPFTAKLIKSCTNKNIAGYYYYELKIPKKDSAYIKISWLYVNGNTAMRIDCYDNWSQYAVKLDCLK
jgi:hypothetical protein